MVHAHGYMSSTYSFLVIPNTKIGQPPPPPPSIRGTSLLIWGVEFPYDLPFPRLSKISCSSSVRVIMTPALIALRSKSNRKLLRSRSKKGSLLFHSISRATSFLKQSTLWVGESIGTRSTTTCVWKLFSCQPRLKNSLSRALATGDLDPPGATMSLFRRRKFSKTSVTSFHSFGKSPFSTAQA